MKELARTSIPLMEEFLFQRAEIMSDRESATPESYSPPLSDTLTPGLRNQALEHDSAGLVTRSRETATISFDDLMDRPDLMGNIEGMIDKYSGKMKG